MYCVIFLSLVVVIVHQYKISEENALQSGISLGSKAQRKTMTIPSVSS